ncbi:PepSY-associated TM helix domain-containing protein [Alkaliflexus imshenetskii]|uniref:PepSY-associated TM helix domain-containing protein n=1 Tax=Alkaliflexus imshenetskii TaxID=286730 RepID=UPI00047880CB|nr:PepSY-associated TM helix domain-containing protein [Alkaliflexus imshenetskii]
MKTNWRKWNRSIHRDLGYFFAGITIVYALSGIAINHRNDWNPNYIITHEEQSLFSDNELKSGDRKAIVEFLERQQLNNRYKSHFRPSPDQIRIFLTGDASITLNFTTESFIFESIRKRPLFYHVNYLHYNPGSWWKWFSDIFAVALIVISITGLFIIKGKNGISYRGALLSLAGLLIPILFLIFHKGS